MGEGGGVCSLSFFSGRGSDADHAVSVECFFEHFAVTGFEDVEGKGSVRKEHGFGQDDGAAGFWNRDHDREEGRRERLR